MGWRPIGEYKCTDICMYTCIIDAYISAYVRCLTVLRSIYSWLRRTNKCYVKYFQGGKCLILQHCLLRLVAFEVWRNVVRTQMLCSASAQIKKVQKVQLLQIKGKCYNALNKVGYRTRIPSNILPSFPMWLCPYRIFKTLTFFFFLTLSTS